MTAAISHEEAKNFKNMCKTFALENLQKPNIGEHNSNAENLLPTAGTNASSAGPLVHETAFESIKEANAELQNLIRSNSSCSSTTNSSPVLNASFLPNIIKIDKAQKMSSMEMDQLLFYFPLRIKSMQHIITELSALLKTYYSTVSVKPFGSSTYGFGGNRTNFNICITAGKIGLGHYCF